MSHMHHMACFHHYFGECGLQTAEHIMAHEGSARETLVRSSAGQLDVGVRRARASACNQDRSIQHKLTCLYTTNALHRLCSFSNNT